MMVASEAEIVSTLPQRSFVNAIEKPNGILAKFRTSDGKMVYEEIKFNNYMYIPKIHFEDIEYVFDKYKIKQFEDSGDYVKIVYGNNFERSKILTELRLNGVEPKEGDINSVKRYLIDNFDQIEMFGELQKWCMYDIETIDDEPLEKDFQGNILAKAPIVSIAYIDCDGNKFYLKNQNRRDPTEGEKELLRKHLRVIEQFDMLLGWNSRGFDDTYVKQRCAYHDIDCQAYYMINQLDYMQMCMKGISDDGMERWSLEYVAQRKLHIGKVEVQAKGKGAIKQLWIDSFNEEEKDLDELISLYNTENEEVSLKSYNFKDVHLMYLIEEKIGLIPNHVAVANYVRCPMQETLHNSDLWDFMIMQDAKGLGMVMKSKPSRTEVKRIKEDPTCAVAGAFTFCLQPGFHKTVFKMDAKSFYPTTTTACNICFTTMIDKEYAEANDIPYMTIPADDHVVNGEVTHFDEKYFRKDKRGIIANRMDKLIALRDVKKYEKFKYYESDPDLYNKIKSEEIALKILANSGYGFMGFPSSRCFEPYVANGITQFCRYTIKRVVKLLEEQGFKVVQGDTDSFMITQGTATMSMEEVSILLFKEFNKMSEELGMGSKKFSIKNPETGENEECDHFVIFEHEGTFETMLAIKKKNYASLEIKIDGEGNQVGEPKVAIVGLECKKRNTNPMAKELQKSIVTDMLHEKFKCEEFIEKLYKLKDDFINNRIDPEHLIMKMGLTKPIKEFGQPMIDGKTGDVKRNKNGEIRYASIPAHVKLAKRMMEEGYDINVGDLIEYVVQSQKPIVAITPEEYKNGAEYDREYYWTRIREPVLKILFVTHPEIVEEHAELWFMKQPKNVTKSLATIKKKKLGDDGDDGDDE